MSEKRRVVAVGRIQNRSFAEVPLRMWSLTTVSHQRKQDAEIYGAQEIATQKMRDSVGPAFRRQIDSTALEYVFVEVARQRGVPLPPYLRRAHGQ